MPRFTRRTILRSTLALLATAGFSAGANAQCPNFAMVARSAFPTGPSPVAIAAGDLDGDGDLDAVTANSGANTVSVLINSGGVFAPPVDIAIPVGTSARGVALGDLDADGDLDIVVSGFASQGRICILLNNADATFAPRVDYAASGPAGPLAIADIDADADLDIVALISPGSGTSHVDLLLNNGNGTFGAYTDQPTAALTTAIALGDVDADTLPDLAALTSSGRVIVARNTGKGYFDTDNAVPIPTGLTGDSLALGDVDGDGALDIVVGGVTSLSLPPGPGVQVLRNLGDATFAPGQGYAVGERAVALCLVDADADAALDVVACCERGTVSVLLNDGSGALVPSVSAGAGQGLRAVVVADFDASGTPDALVAAASDNAAILVANVTSAVIAFPAVEYPVAPLPTSVTSADFNADGRVDLGVASRDSDSVSVLLNVDGSTFAPAVIYPVGDGPFALAASDVDGDADADLLVNCSGDVLLLRNNSDGTFAPGVPVVLGLATNGMAVGDLDGDADPDLVLAREVDQKLRVLLNNGDGTFAGPVAYTVDATANGPALGDIDADGDLDVVIAGNLSVFVFINDGDGALSAAPSFAEFYADGLALGDVDGDADADMVSYSTGFPRFLGVRLSNGDGGFGPRVDVVADVSGGARVALVDFDGDADLDALVDGSAGSSVYDRVVAGLFINDGAGDFSLWHAVQTGEGSRALAGADVNADGRPDLVSVRTNRRDVVGVHLNLIPSAASISKQPASRDACPGDAVTFSVTVSGSEPVTYQWRKGSVDLAGATGATYTIPAVSATDAGAYDVVITNACGPVTSDPAVLTVGGPSCCPADWNDDGVVNSTDVSDFINDWFTDQAEGSLVTDFNHDGVSNSTDVSDFISRWFEDQASCAG